MREDLTIFLSMKPRESFLIDHRKGNYQSADDFRLNTILQDEQANLRKNLMGFKIEF